MIIDEFLVRLGALVDDSGIAKFAGGLAGLGGVAAAASAAIGGALAKINDFVGDALGGLDDLNDLADRTGQSLEFVQEFGYAAQLNGSSVEKANASIEGLSQVIGEAANGLGRGAMTFEKLGMSARNADGSVKTVRQVIGEVQDKIKALSAQQQLSILSKLGIDQSMIQTLRLGRDELAKFYQEAHDLGLITAEGADAAGDYNDAMDRLRMVQSALRTNIAVGLAPTFIHLIDTLKAFLITNKDVIRDGVSRLVAILVSAGTALWNFFRAIDRVISKTVGWKAALTALAVTLGLIFATNPVVLFAAALAGIVALVDDFMTYMDGGESQFGPFWQKLIAFAREAKDLIDGNAGAFKALGVVLAGLALGKVVAGYQAIIIVVAKLIGVLTGPLIAAIRTAALVFRAAFASNPIGLIISLVALLAYVIYENFDKIKEWIGAAWDWISERTQAAFDAMLAVFAPTIDYFKTLFGVVADVLTGNFSGAFEKIEAFWQRTVGRIMAGVERVKGFFRSIGKTLGVVNEDVAGVTQAVNDKVAGASTVATQAAANGAVPVGGNTTVTVQQDVKMDVRTDDPTLAGNTAANNLKREAQFASRNARGAVAY
ncbi:Phage-related protein [Luteibacter sp. UNC138MFCol5.1]|uniref:hypothetical protein n=1 Tax=Luteibacter sp. UNC138MFCol5.1 TaxID=1502774 RepID=UPI0008C09767|nr:hypothetical protein [Luteibacter sp. UNC138MFCol5.1]SEO76271.1 Phage-related protein [Luteibacter sp. UNC138MFCol5.1]